MASQLTLFGDSTVNTKSTRRTYTRESKLSVVAVPRYQLFTHRSPPVCCMQVWGVSPWMPSCSFLVSGVFLAGLEGFQEEAAPSSLANFSGTIMYNIDDLYDSTLLSCTCATKKVSWFWRCGQILPSLLSAYWVLSAYFLAVLEISVCAY